MSAWEHNPGGQWSVWRSCYGPAWVQREKRRETTLCTPSPKLAATHNERLAEWLGSRLEFSSFCDCLSSCGWGWLCSGSSCRGGNKTVRGQHMWFLECRCVDMNLCWRQTARLNAHCRWEKAVQRQDFGCVNLRAVPLSWTLVELSVLTNSRQRNDTVAFIRYRVPRTVAMPISCDLGCIVFGAAADLGEGFAPPHG